MITRITLLASLLALPFLGKAEGEPQTVSTKIKAVTVFLNGAQVTRSARASLVAGTQQIKFTGLTAQLDPGSVQVQGEGDFTILSVTSEMNYPEPTLKDLPITEIVRLQTERLKVSDQLALEEALLQALNESFSDVFGSLVKQYSLNQTADQADWLIGADLLTDNVQGVALRSMKAPGTAYDDPVLGKDPQPAHMDDYKNVSYDNGGVHINSGIPNRAFYLVATELGGHAWEKAGRIWYITLRDKLQSNSDFEDAARETFNVAGELYGEGSPEQTAVRNGWAGVGLSVGEDDGGDGDGGDEPQGCLQSVAGLLGMRLVRDK